MIPQSIRTSMDGGFQLPFRQLSFLDEHPGQPLQHQPVQLRVIQKHESPLDQVAERRNPLFAYDSANRLSPTLSLPFFPSLFLQHASRNDPSSRIAKVSR